MLKKIIILATLSLAFTGCSSSSSLPISVSKKENLSSSVPISNGKTLSVHYLDVGQGDSTLILTPNGESILIDGGNNDKGDTVVSDLKKFGVKALDVVVATHPDADHVGGLDTVIN